MSYVATFVRNRSANCRKSKPLDPHSRPKLPFLVGVTSPPSGLCMHASMLQPRTCKRCPPRPSLSHRTGTAAGQARVLSAPVVPQRIGSSGHVARAAACRRVAGGVPADGCETQHRIDNVCRTRRVCCVDADCGDTTVLRERVLFPDPPQPLASMHRKSRSQPARERAPPERLTTTSFVGKRRDRPSDDSSR